MRLNKYPAPRARRAIAIFVLWHAAAAAQEAPVGADRARIIAALDRAKLLNPGRVLAHVSHVCNLSIDGKAYPVADVRELIRNASVARGYNRIVVLDDSLHVRQEIQYEDERPLFCGGNRLYVYGDLHIHGEDPGGNILVFTNGARHIGLLNADPNTWPTREELEKRGKK
ncbi:MAG: hypothetical protein ABSH56_16865 [Bryobacteraceae bacterium]|jgi:hypothetical protein